MPNINNINISDAEFTAMQELATAFICKRAFKDNKKFNSPESIIKDKPTKKGLEDGIRLTKNNSGLTLCLALNYGSRQEIINSIKLIAKAFQQGQISIDDINQKLFSSYLYTNKIPDPDLLIRTSGENRLSNFLLWQSAYTEIFMTKTYWPDFRENELFNAIINYQSRERRFGKVSEQISS